MRVLNAPIRDRDAKVVVGRFNAEKARLPGCECEHGVPDGRVAGVCEVKMTA
jgi:hypothetical protein